MNVPFLDLKKQYGELLEEIQKQVMPIFESCAFVGGKYVAEFEKQIQDYLGVKHAIGCGNGTDALVLALRACGVRPGDEVITTPFTFFATAEAIAAVGAKPVFIDIRKSDYMMDPAGIEPAITEKTKAVLPVHIFGGACDMDEILTVAHRHGLYVIEDDAQAIGMEYRGRKAGTLADIGCFSFYPTKNLGGCGDGGMVTTNDDKLAVNVRALHEHGAGKNGAAAYENIEGASAPLSSSEQATELYDPYKYFNFLIGYNSRLDAIQACVLSIKLKHLDEYNAKRAHHAKYYIEHLTDKVTVPQYPADTKPCWHQFAVLSDYKYELSAYLAEHGVGSGTFYPVPLHQQKAFNAGNCKNPGASLPVAEEVSSKSVCLPIFPEMTDEQLEYVVSVIDRFYKEKE